MAEVRSSGPQMGQLVIYTQTQSESVRCNAGGLALARFGPPWGGGKWGA
jgi:hypothetical protein